MSILFSNVCVVPLQNTSHDDTFENFRHSFVVVDGTKIRSVTTERPPEEPFEREIDGHGGILMPGLINCHTHLPMTAMRGYGDGHNLQDWLQDWIFPVEAKWDARAIRACADLGLMEMIASGTTCIADMYMQTGTIAQAIADAGISANLSCGGVFFGEKFSPETCADCKNQQELYDAWHNFDDGRIQVDASIHAEYTSKPGLWEWMADFARTHSLQMQVHISETQREHEECKQRWGDTPIQILAKHGVFDVPALAAHCVWTEPDDWALMAEKHITAVHNPVSNLKLGSGIAPVTAMQKAGVNIALGTDGVSSNNTTDLFEDLKLASILQNGVLHDPQALSARDALQFATINGAKALGRKTGSIQAGFDADLILLDPNAPNLLPGVHSAVHAIVYAAHGANVKLNMCRGKVIYENGDFLTIDADQVRHDVETYAVAKLFLPF